MKILLLGSGGREHCLAWKMAQSPLCEKLWIAPGNAGTKSVGENVEIDPMDFKKVKSFILEEKADILVVGPEAPLVKGIYDFLKADDQLGELIIIGPDQKGAQLEGSKAFAKEFMEGLNIPTASYRSFNAEQLNEALAHLDQCNMPIVLKADGLAAGKGVIICHSLAKAKQELREMLDGKFGEASSHVVIEEFLSGREFSVFALTDGQDYLVLPIAKDYKKAGEGDEGPNTGGMGSVSPVSFISQDLLNKVTERIIEPTIRGIADLGCIYKGFVFFGLIEVGGEPYVIEYNCRMGDPETQVVIPRLENDLVELLKACSEGSLKDCKISILKEAAAAVILVSGGYPASYEKGKTISGIQHDPGHLLFHAGTKQEDGKIVTNGGRVLAVTSLHANLNSALSQTYKRIQSISFDKAYYRRDIGFDV